MSTSWAWVFRQADAKIWQLTLQGPFSKLSCQFQPLLKESGGNGYSGYRALRGHLEGMGPFLVHLHVEERSQNGSLRISSIGRQWDGQGLFSVPLTMVLSRKPRAASKLQSCCSQPWNRFVPPTSLNRVSWSRLWNSRAQEPICHEIVGVVWTHHHRPGIVCHVAIINFQEILLQHCPGYISISPIYSNVQNPDRCQRIVSSWKWTNSQK